MNYTIQNQSLFSRLWLYQKERFPIFQHGLLILAFTYAAVNYSIISRGGENFISTTYFIVGALTTLCLFFGMRVLDEIKDKDKDLKYRSDLPVPRGLVSISELSVVAILFFISVVVGISFVYAKMFLPLIIVLVYLAFMTYEFFIPKFLNNNLLLYASSHMLIIPLIDIYASGLDWYMNGVGPHIGLIIFFVVSFFNGMALEIGRKIKAPKDEASGVDTYSSMLGINKSIALWFIVLTVTYITSLIAIHHAGIGFASMAFLSIVYIVSVIVGMNFYSHKTTKRSKMIENVSGIWTLSMYLILGNIPNQIFNLF